MKICKNCGNQVPDNSLFCTNCGEKIKENKNNSLMVIIISLLIILIIMIVAMIFMFSKNKETEISMQTTQIATTAPTIQPVPTPTVTIQTVAPANVYVQQNEPTKTVEPFTRSTRDIEFDKEQIDSLGYNSLLAFTYGISTGDTSELSSYYKTGTKDYNETVSYIRQKSNEGFSEDLNSYRVYNIKWLSDNECRFTLYSNIKVYKPNGDIKNVEETYQYDAQKINGNWKIIKKYD